MAIGGDIPNTETDDWTLLTRAVSGDSACAYTLHARFANRVVSFLYSRMMDRVMADDIAQDVWLQVFRRPPEPTGCFSAWLMTVTANRYVSYVRRQTASPETTFSVILDGLPEIDQNSSVEFDRKTSDLRVCVSQLPTELREVVERTLQGRSHQDVATELSIPVNTSYTRRHRALEWLRVCMTAKGWTDEATE